MQRRIRLTLAALFFMAVTALFFDFTGTIHTWLGWMAKIQFLPALMALNVGVVALLVLLTLLPGRVYCRPECTRCSDVCSALSFGSDTDDTIRQR